MSNANNASELKAVQEAQLSQNIESELTDEQLLQLAEGSGSWGAHCNESCR